MPTVIIGVIAPPLDRILELDSSVTRRLSSPSETYLDSYDTLLGTDTLLAVEQSSFESRSGVCAMTPMNTVNTQAVGDAYLANFTLNTRMPQRLLLCSWTVGVRRDQPLSVVSVDFFAMPEVVSSGRSERAKAKRRRSGELVYSEMGERTRLECCQQHLPFKQPAKVDERFAVHAFRSVTSQEYRVGGGPHSICTTKAFYKHMRANEAPSWSPPAWVLHQLPAWASQHREESPTFQIDCVMCAKQNSPR